MTQEPQIGVSQYGLPHQQGLPFDIGNQFINPMAPATIESWTDVPGVPRHLMLVTIRTYNASLTAFLDGPSADAWIDNITTIRKKLSGIVVPPPGFSMPPPPTDGQRPR